MSHSGLTFIEDSPYEWNPMMLALEGGGTRGYASLLMMQPLLHQIKEIETAEKPHQRLVEHLVGDPDRVVADWKPHLSSFGPVLEQLPSPPSLLRKTTQASHKSTSRKKTGEAEEEDGFDRLAKIREKKGVFLPCHYFDYIGGTSTGGLSALMLGRLRMSVAECLDPYQDMAQNVFGHKQRFAFGGLAKDRYDAKILEKQIKEIVRSRIATDETDIEFYKMPAPEDLCRTVVFSNKVDKDGNGCGRPYLFRTYRNDAPGSNKYNPGPPHNCFVWEAGRATSAAPNYLKGIVLREDSNGEEAYFLDGATACNDPSRELLEEAIDLEKGAAGVSRSVMLTLGTGLKAGKRGKAGGLLGKMVPRRQHRNLRVVLERFSHDGFVRSNMDREMKNHEGFKWYKWHGGLEVGAMGLDKSKPMHFDRMDEGVANYMKEEDIKKEVLEVAVRLVAERRRRYKLTPDKWIRYSGATLVECPLRHCEADESIFGTRTKAAIHVRDVHPNGEYGGDLNRVQLRQPFLRGPWHSIEFRKAEELAYGLPADPNRRESQVAQT